MLGLRVLGFEGLAFRDTTTLYHPLEEPKIEALGFGIEGAL